MKTKISKTGIVLKTLIVFSFFAFHFSFISAQYIGINHTGATPSSATILDLNTGNAGVNKGFLPPQVAITGTNDNSTISGADIGLIIYNTATSGTAPNNVVPGYYYWTGSAWVLMLAPSAGTSGQVLTSNGGGAPSWTTPAGGAIGGSGTNGYVALWTPNGTTLGNSVIQDDGFEVGINTAPVAGNIVYVATGSGNGVYSQTNDAAGYAVQGYNNASGGTGIYGSGSIGVFGDGSIGVLGETFNASSYGVKGYNFAGTGIYGSATTSGYYGVNGNNSAGTGIYGTGTLDGVDGQTNNLNGYGIYGNSTASGGTGVYGSASGVGSWGVLGTGQLGVYGKSSSSSGLGVEGDNSAGDGVYGFSSASGHNGVFGYNGSGTGVYGQSANSTWYGVEGNNTATGGTGVYGTASGSGASGIYGLASGASSYGVQGASLLGNGVYGYAENSTGYGVYGANGVGTGVYGYAQNASYYGVEGFNLNGIGIYGNGGSNGVLGRTIASSGTGVYGINASNTGGDGVYGTGYTGVYGLATNGGGYGVYGENGGSGGIGVFGQGYYGMYGTTNIASGYGVEGINTATSGTPVGVYGSGFIGVYGNGGVTGVYAVCTAASNAGQAFLGYNDITNHAVYMGYYNGSTEYKIVGSGTVSTIVKDTKNKDVVMHAPETPEVYFEDYGAGQLVNGKVHIELDPDLAKNVTINEKHTLKVFIQLEGDCKGVYVTNKTATGFDVIELGGGNSNTSFSWHIVCNRADENLSSGKISKFADLRFENAPPAQIVAQPKSK